MKKISAKELIGAIVPGTQTCLSVYINKKTDLSFALTEIQRVAGNDLPLEELNQLLYPIENFYSLIPQELQHKGGIGIFITKNFAAYSLIPFEVKVIAAVAQSFHVKPLLKWMQKERTYALLQIDKYKISYYTGDLVQLTQHETILFPNQKLNVKKHTFEKIDQMIQKLHGKNSHPLLVIGDQDHCDQYKKISTYRNMVTSIFDDKSETSTVKLHTLTKELLPFYFSMMENKTIKEYWTAKSKGHTSSNLDDIVQLALKGLVKNIFINENMNLWGRINYQTGECVYYKGQRDSIDEDILDDLAEVVLLHGGAVTVLPAHRMPDSLAAAAITRSYPREFGTSIAV